MLTCSFVTGSHFSTDFLNFLIAIFILNLKSKFLWCNFKDLLTAFFADCVIGIPIQKQMLKYYLSSPGEGLEPTTQWLTVICSTDWAIPDCLTNEDIVIRKHFSILFCTFFISYNNHQFYREQDSNLHTSRHLVLSQACLPIPPSRHVSSGARIRT